MMMFKNTNIIKELVSHNSNPSMAFLDSFINTINKGIIIGKLNMAISVKLLFVFDAIADTIVNNDEKPKLPNIKVMINKPKS